jgi:hypothetical protein
LALSVDDRLVLSSAIFSLHVMTDLLKTTESELLKMANISIQKMTSDKVYLKLKEQSLKKAKSEKGIVILFIYLCILTFLYTYFYIYICIYICIYIYIYIFICIIHISIIHMCINIYIFKWICIYMSKY